jgi:hypothetical protein
MRALVAEQRRTKQQQFEKPQEQRRVESQGRAPQRSKL